MANISVAKKVIEAGRKSGVSTWLWGGHGIGKSESVEQVAKAKGIEFIDVRAALTEAGDWMGLPIANKNEDGKMVAEFCISSFLPQDPNWKGILFLDELNRARPDIINCVFQLVLNHKIQNHYTLPKGASIVAAGNPGDDEYDVTSIDPALLGRFCHLPLTPSQKEWINYSKETGCRKDIINFIQGNSKMLDHSVKPFDLKLIKPSRRGWTLLSRMVDALDELGYTDECLDDVASGLVGTTAAVQYAEFRRSNYLRIDVSKILKSYKDVKPSVLKVVEQGKLPEQKQALEELFEHASFKESIIKKNAAQLSNLLEFLTDISEDISYVGAKKIIEEHDSLIDIILDWVQDPAHNYHKVAQKFYDIIITVSKASEGK